MESALPEIFFSIRSHSVILVTYASGHVTLVEVRIEGFDSHAKISDIC